MLDGRKDATRRIVKGFIPDDAVWGYTAFTPKGYISCRGTFADGYGEKFFKLPCEPGDILYVRETWQCWRAHRYEATADIRFRAGGDDVRLQFANGNTDSIDRLDYDTFVHKWFSHNGEWKPSLFMPKEAARIWLKVTDVRVERLKDITEDGALREGSQGIRCNHGALGEHGCTDCMNTGWIEPPQVEFMQIWNSTIKKSDIDRYGWDANPYVWVIEFERCEKPEGV
nr:MAG TPA: ASCH domain protein [Caudoviricetes sp.]